MQGKGTFKSKIMNPTDHLKAFLQRSAKDTRITPLHISLYTAILFLWSKENNDRTKEPNDTGVAVSARSLMPIARISSAGPYHRKIRQLHEYGYIRYQPSRDPATPSKVFLSIEFYANRHT
jgi:hypothetical protein